MRGYAPGVYECWRSECIAADIEIEDASGSMYRLATVKAAQKKYRERKKAARLLEQQGSR